MYYLVHCIYCPHIIVLILCVQVVPSEIHNETMCVSMVCKILNVSFIKEQ